MAHMSNGLSPEAVVELGKRRQLEPGDITSCLVLSQTSEAHRPLKLSDSAGQRSADSGQILPDHHHRIVGMHRGD